MVVDWVCWLVCWLVDWVGWLGCGWLIVGCHCVFFFWGGGYVEAKFQMNKTIELQAPSPNVSKCHPKK